MDSATFWAWVFGFASLASLVLAIYIHFKSKELILPLIEKLRASKNSFDQIGKVANRIVSVAESRELNPEDKIRQVRQLARTVSESINSYVNTIDDGVDWSHMSAKEIYGKMK